MATLDEYNTFLPELMLRACDLDRTDGWKLAIARLASISYTGPVLGRSVGQAAEVSAVLTPHLKLVKLCFEIYGIIY